MKRFIILFIVSLFSFQLFSQGCYDPLNDFIEKVEEVNGYKAGFQFGLPGSQLTTKSEYFIEVWTEIKMSKIDSDLGYVANQHFSGKHNFVGFTQTYKGVPVEGTQLVLGFNNNGYLTQFSHYGIDDSSRIPIVKSIDHTARISNAEEATLTSHNENMKMEFVDGTALISNKKEINTELLKTIVNPPPPPPPAQMIAGSIWVGTLPNGYTYSCDGNIVAQNGLQEVGVGGSQAGLPNDRLTLVQVSGNYKIRDNEDAIFYIGETNYAHNSSDYLICPEQSNTSSDPAGKFEYAMCYNYLTHFSEFFDANIATHGVSNFGNLIFDPYDGSASLTYIVSPELLTFGAADNNNITGYHDLAEDVHFIAEGAAHYWWKNNFSGSMPSDADMGDGVLYGTLDYLASQFTGGSPEVLSWGGNGSSRVLNLDLGVNYGNFFDASVSAQINGQLWGSTLNDIAVHGQLGSVICNELLARAMIVMNGGTGQEEAAIILFNQGKAMRDESLLTIPQLCILVGILDNRYPSAEIDDLSKDVYIKDSYAGQQTSYGTNAEDMGVEPSVTTNFWISPAIWNRHAADQGTTHLNPTHYLDQPNYLHVELRERGCSKPDGVLKMYFSEASTGHVWPEDWDNVIPTNDHLGYFVGSVDLSDNVAVYIDNNELVYLYIIPWIPLDPTDFEGYSSGDKMHGCVIGRIVSNEDPMFNEQEDVHVSVNSKNNNNVAMKNMSVMHIESGPVSPPTAPDKHVFIIKHGKTPDLNGLNPVRDAIKINVVPGGAINPDELFDYGNIEIELSDDLLKAWIDGGMQGQNIKYAKPNRILIYNTDASLENLVIDPLRKYPIRVMFNRTRDLLHKAQFDITLWNENECEVGGEMYQLVPSVELGMRSFESTNSISETTLSPNPVADELTIDSNLDFDVSQIKLFNTSGRKFSPEMVTKNEKSVLINTTSLQSGIYFITIKRESGDFENVKFIKI